MLEQRSNNEEWWDKHFPVVYELVPIKLEDLKKTKTHTR